jgi:hypothetical protein
MSTKVKDFLITVDGEPTTMIAFIEANTAEDVCQPDPLDLQAIPHMRPGDVIHLPVHAGWAEIKRPIEVELDNYEQFQLEKYGNVLSAVSVLPDGTCENGIDEIERQAEWINSQAEQQLFENQN